MISSRKQLNEILSYEKRLNWDNFNDKELKYQIFLSYLKRHPQWFNFKYIIALRKAGYYYTKRKKNIIFGILYILSCRKKNRLGRKLGIECNEQTFEKGLVIYHSQGIVVNGLARVGANCHLHGNNCIGTDGITADCPIIGNNVVLGVGAKVLGGVRIANDITIAAGAVVVDSFLEPGVVIGGVPARIIKRK